MCVTLALLSFQPGVSFKYTNFAHKINVLMHVHFNCHHFLFGNWNRANFKPLIFSLSHSTHMKTEVALRKLFSYTLLPPSGYVVHNTFTVHY